MSALGHRDQAILRVLSEDGGFTTKWVVHYAWDGHGRRASAEVRQRLLRLQKAGLVRPLDDQKPTAWSRTPAGSAALSPTPTDAGETKT